MDSISMRSETRFGAMLLAIVLGSAVSRAASPEGVGGIDGNYVIQNFHFASGETLPELRLHYVTLGKVHRNAQGHVDNAVLILHGSGGRGKNFLRERFAGVLFGKDQLLDAHRYYLIMPDGIGHGDSSKPSDGLHARFPHYDYADMVLAQHTLVAEGLGVDHLRLVMGTSMGCMHTFMWGERYAAEVDALMPLACLPVAIAGRNRVWRKLLIDAIRSDKDYLEGEYRTEPAEALRAAASLLLIAGSAPLEMQHDLPTREAADAFVEKYMQLELDDLDANDLLYAIDASRNYDPQPALDQISAPVMWVNSGDDFINPPELGIAEREARRLKNGRFVLLPGSEQTHGHGSHSWAALWQGYLKELLERSGPSRSPAAPPK
jgi:homoserine O-acetyltransferase